MTKTTDTRLVLLHDTDNIFVCCQKISAGESIYLEGDTLIIKTDINVGHKLARNNISIKGKVYKYGASIGSAKADIEKADHVHLHNLKSDYMPSYQRSGVIDDSLSNTSSDTKSDASKVNA